MDTGIDATPQLNISSSIFEGVSFTAGSTTHLEDLEALPEVRNVWHARKIPRPDAEVHAIGKDATPKWTSHENTGVLDLHKKGIQGEGATVAIVDTGMVVLLHAEFVADLKKESTITIRVWVVGLERDSRSPVELISLEMTTRAVISSRTMIRQIMMDTVLM